MGKRYVEVFSSSATEKQAACDRNRATMRDDAGYRGVLRLRGLPFSTAVDEVLDFFGQSAALKRENIHLMRRADGRASGDAYAVFDTEEAAVAALSFDKQKLGSRWVDLFQSSKGELYSLTSVGGIMLGSDTLGISQGGEVAEPAVALGDGEESVVGRPHATPLQRLPLPRYVLPPLQTTSPTCYVPHLLLP